MYIFLLSDISATEQTLSVELLVLKTVQRLLEQQLAALMVGAAIMLLFLIKYWDVPKKWTTLNERIIRIERRQKKLFEILKIYFNNDKVSNFLSDNIEDLEYYSEKRANQDDED